MSRDEEDVFRSRTPEPLTFGLFAEAHASATLDDEDGEGARSVNRAKRMEAPGAGQSARRAARGRQSLEASYRRIALALEAYPNGLTRSEIAGTLGMPANSVNPRVSEMRARTDEYRVVTDGRRGGESVCHLARLRT